MNGHRRVVLLVLLIWLALLPALPLAAREVPLLAGREMSLDASTNDAPPAVERMTAKGPNPEEEAGAQEAQSQAESAVSHALRGLTERELLIVRERLMKDEPVTLQRLGEMLGVSKERVRQLEERARGKLRGSLESFRAHAQTL